VLAAASYISAMVYPKNFLNIISVSSFCFLVSFLYLKFGLLER
jgi:hypothetical protein